MLSKLQFPMKYHYSITWIPKPKHIRNLSSASPLLVLFSFLLLATEVFLIIIFHWQILLFTGLLAKSSRCIMDLALRPLFQGNTSDISAFGKEKRLPLVLKVYTRLPSKVNLNAPRPGARNAPIIKAVATFEPKHFVQSENAVKQDNELQLGSQSSSQTLLSTSVDSIEMGEREISRRMKISKANKGNVPWNKGRKHSPGGNLKSRLDLLVRFFLVYCCIFHL